METAQLGGAEVQMLAVAETLLARGHSALFLVPAPGPLADRLHKLPAPVCCIAQPRLLSTSFHLPSGSLWLNPLSWLINPLSGLLWTIRLWLTLRQSPGTLISSGVWGQLFGGLAARLAGCRVIWMCHTIARHPLHLTLLRWAAHAIPHQLVCPSAPIRASYGAAPAVARKTTLIPNGLRVAHFGPRPVGPRPHGFEIGTVARLTEWKGHHLALAVARQLHAQRLHFRWRFAGNAALGSTAYRQRLLDLCRTWQLEGCVEWLDFVEDMPAFYRSLDVLVHLPTRPEPFGLALTEALASGLPVLCSPGSGAEPYVLAGGGAVLPPNDTAALADVLLHWAANPQERARRGAAGRAIVEAELDIEVYTDRLLRLLETTP